MQKEEYTFVTIDDENDGLFSDAVVVDLDNDTLADGIVIIDEDFDNHTFITMADDTVILSDADMINSYSSDMDDMDISICL